MAGKDRGKTGKVERVLPREGKLIVGGLNLVKFHQKPRRKDQRGQIVEKSMPIDTSNVMIIDPQSKKPTRVGRKPNEGGQLKRFSKRTGVFID